MAEQRIHLVSPAAACRPFLDALRVGTSAELVALLREVIGSGYALTADAALIEVEENDQRGGRRDDRERARDMEAALGDDSVSAIVMLRGGAWLTRILPRIDFSVLDRRTRPVAVFGFSEATSLVNIVGAHPAGRGVYDMGPAFLTYGLKRYASVRTAWDAPADAKPAAWMQERLWPEVTAYFHDVLWMIEGRGTRRRIVATLVRGEIGRETSAQFVGGNLTVLTALVGSAYQACVEPSQRWLLLEDFNDRMDRMDRFLANLTLAGFWSRCAGLLLGDFHRGYEDLRPAVLELLPFHIPPECALPVLTTDQVGHVWPMSPLLLHQPVRLTRTGDGTFDVTWADAILAVV